MISAWKIRICLPALNVIFLFIQPKDCFDFTCRLFNVLKKVFYSSCNGGGCAIDKRIENHKFTHTHAMTTMSMVSVWRGKWQRVLRKKKLIKERTSNECIVEVSMTLVTKKKRRKITSRVKNRIAKGRTKRKKQKKTKKNRDKMKIKSDEIPLMPAV